MEIPAGIDPSERLVSKPQTTVTVSETARLPEIPLPEIVRFRQALGLPGQPTPIHLLAIKAARKQKTDEHLQTIKERKGIVTQSSEAMQKRRQECTEYLKKLPFGKKIERAWVGAKLRLKGVKNPDKVISALEQQASPLIFDYSYTSGEEKIHDVSYDSLLYESTSAVLVKNDRLPLALDRFEQLGYRVSSYLLENPLLVSALEQISRIPQETFDGFLKSLDSYTCVQDDHDLFVLKDQGTYELDFSKLSPNLELLLNIAGQGGFTPEQQDILTIASKVSDMSRSKSFSSTFPLEWILQNKNQLIDMAIILEECCRFPDQKQYGWYLANNLNYLAKTGDLHQLAVLLESGYELTSSEVYLLFARDIAKEEPDYIHNKALELSANIKTATAASSQPEYLKAMQEYYQQWGLNDVSKLQQAAEFYHKVFLEIEQLTPRQRVVLLQHLAAWADYSDIENLPCRNELNNLYSAGNNNPFFQDKAEINAILSGFLLYNLDTNFIKEQIIQGEIPPAMLSETIISRLPEQERLFWRLWRDSDNRARPTLLQFLYQDPEEMNKFIATGKLSPDFFIKAVAANINQPWEYDTLGTLLTNEVLAAFPPEQKAAWGFWRGAPYGFKKAIMEQKANWPVFFDSNGRITPAFFETLAKNAKDISDEYELSDVLSGLTFALTDEILNLFPPEKRDFWGVWRQAPARPCKLFLIAREEDFGRFYAEGKLTAYFFQEALTAIGAVPIVSMLTADAISAMPKSEQAFWQFLSNCPVNILYGSTDLFAPQKIAAIRSALEDNRLVAIMDGLNVIHRATLYQALIWSPDTATKAAEICDALNDPEVAKCCQTLPPDGQQGFIDLLIRQPKTKDGLLTTLSDKNVMRVIREFPDTAAYFLINQPEYSRNFAACVFSSDLYSFLKQYPQYFALFKKSYEDLYLKEAAGTIDKKIFMQMARNICSVEPNPKSLLNAIGDLAPFTGKSRNELIIENFESIYTAQLSQTAFVADVLNAISLTPQQAISILQNASTPESRLGILIEVLPAADYPSQFYVQVLAGLPTRIISPTDIKYLLAAIHKTGGMKQMLTNRPAVTALLGKVSPALGNHLVSQVLHLQSYSDDTDFNRNQVTPDADRESRDRGRETKNAPSFAEQVAGLNIKPEEKETLLAIHSVIRQAVGREQVAQELLEKIGGAERGTLISALNEFQKQRLPQDQLDQRAEEFEIYHQRLDKQRIIPAFEKLWAEKVRQYFEATALSAVMRGGNTAAAAAAADTLRLYNDGLKLYQNISAEVVPALQTLAQTVDARLFGQGVWFSGRDGVPLYLTVKASHFGVKLGERLKFRSVILPQIQNDPRRQDALIKLAVETDKRPLPATEDERTQLLDRGLELYFQTEARIYDLLKYAPISRLVFSNAKTPEDKGNVKRMLISKGINPSMVGVDTGTTGSVMKTAMALLGGISRENMIIWGSGQDIDMPFSMIERLPKKYERTLEITAEGKPVRTPQTLDVQLLNWVADHAVIRHFVPRRPVERIEPASITAYRHAEIAKYIRANTPQSTPLEQQKLIEDTTELYNKSREIIAPVIVSFADHLLKMVKGPGTRIVFAARDGIGPYKAAERLLAKFTADYPQVSPQQLSYAYLTRKVVNNSPADTLQEYFQQLGISTDEDIILADVGMFGTIISQIRAKLNAYPIRSVEYLISRTPEANGFIDNGADKQMSAFSQIIGNPAVHFIEDTFSGPIQSPTGLVKTEIGWQPNTADLGYPPEIAVKREFALRAIQDFVEGMTTVNIDLEAVKSRLNEYLLDEKNFARLAVPHER